MGAGLAHVHAAHGRPGGADAGDELMAFQVKNLNTISDPLLQEALKSIEDTINNTGAISGVTPNAVATTPTNPGSLAVLQTAGIYDVTINDPANQRGETYFLEWDTQASFASARMIELGASRHYRGTLGNLGNTYWRFYKQLQGSNASAWINSSANPVAGGGTAGPTPGVPKGSGSSSQSGQGLGTIGG